MVSTCVPCFWFPHQALSSCAESGRGSFRTCSMCCNVIVTSSCPAGSSRRYFSTGEYLSAMLILYMQFHSSILSSNSFSASNSSLERVTPLPIFSRSGDQSRRSYFASRSFQLIRFSSFDQPEPALDSTPICLMISYFISDMWLLLVDEF